MLDSKLYPLYFIAMRYREQKMCVKKKIESAPKHVVASMIRPFFCVFFAASLSSGPAYAQTIAIENAGFEDFYQGQAVATGDFPVGPAPTGWTRYDLNGSPVAGSLLGVLNPGTQADYDADGGGLTPCFPDGAPEGDNVALLFKTGSAAAEEYGIEQQLNSTLSANTLYTLSVEVGNIQTCEGLINRNTFNLDGFPGYRIELRAGTEIIAQDDNTLLPGEGMFERSTIQFQSGQFHDAMDQPLVIRLIGLNNTTGGGNLEVDFDDVRLTASPVAAVPIPFFGMILLAGLFILSVAITNWYRQT